MPANPFSNILEAAAAAAGTAVAASRNDPHIKQTSTCNEHDQTFLRIYVKNTPGSRGEGSGRGHKGGKDNNSVDHGDIISSIIDTKLKLYGKWWLFANEYTAS